MEHNEEALLRALATEIKMAMVSAGWNQQELADRVGITRESLSRYLGSKKAIPMATYFRVSEAFDFTPYDLLQRASERAGSED